MGQVDPYELDQIQFLTKRAEEDHRPRIERWDALDRLYRYGRVQEEHRDLLGFDRLNIDAADQVEFVINMVLPNVTLLMETVVNEDPSWGVKWRRDGNDAISRAGRDLVTHFWERMNGTQIGRTCTQDLILYGAGIGKLGWETSEAEYERPEEEVEPEIDELEAGDQRLAELFGELGFDDIQHEVRDREQLAEQFVSLTTEVTESNQPYVERVDPRDLMVPEDATRIETARWIIHKVVKPIDEILANDALDHTDQIKPDASDGRHARDVYDPDGDYQGEVTATLYEFYDCRTRTLTIYQLDSEEPLFRDEWDWQHRHHPFVMMRGYSYNNEFWPFGDLEAIAQDQEVLNRVHTAMVRNALRAGTKWVWDKAVDEDEMLDLLSTDESDVGVGLDLNGRPIGDVISALPRPGTDPDVYQVRDRSETAIPDRLGIPELHRGVVADRMPATAAAVVDGIASLRTQNKQREVDQWFSDAGLRVFLMAHERLEIDRGIQIAGPAAEELLLEPIDYHEECSVAIRKGSTRAVNPAVRQERGKSTIREILPVIAEMTGDPAAGAPLLAEALDDMGYDPELADRIFNAVATPPQPEAPMPDQLGMGPEMGLPPEMAMMADGGGGPMDAEALGIPAEPPPPDEPGALPPTGLAGAAELGGGPVL